MPPRGGAAPPSAFSANRKSSPAELRLALLQERGDAFLVVGAVAEFAHQVALQVELLVQGVQPGAADGALGGGEAAGRARGEAGGEPGRLRLQLFVVDALPDQPPGFRPLGGDRFAGERYAE